MIRGLFKLIILVVVVVAAGVFFLGWNLTGDRSAEVDEAGRAIGTAGRAAADAAQRTLADGSLTAKIKAKMSLDDTVKALDLNVDTAGGVVTVKGVVRSEAERVRALQLARETDGVTRVIDQIQVR
jgi:osmotically-inducible protein OsmY